jgi:predicted small lipoprotein YifL
MKRIAYLLSLLALTLSFAGCGCSGSLVVHAFDEETNDPVRAVEVRVEEAGLSARGESSARLNGVPCRAEEYLIHVSSPDGHFEPRFARAAVQDGGVVSVEVKVEINEAGIAAKKRDKELEGDPLGRLADSVEKALPR